jgi:hypothetical protein
VNIGETISGALFSDSNKKYRYALWRIWDRSKRALLFVGLNPSTANEIHNDPTIVRLANFAKSWGYGGLYCGNLFSLVSANPDVLWISPCTEQPGGPTDMALQQMRSLSSIVMVGWGNEGRNAGKRPEEVLKLLGVPVYCIKTTLSGEPIHPLYMPSSSKLIPYVRRS